MAVDRPAQPVVVVTTERAPITVVQVPVELRMYSVTEERLTEIASSTSTIHVGFFGIGVGGSIAFAITLATVDISNPYAYASFWAALGVSVLTSIYSGIRAVLDFKSTKRRIRSIVGHR